MAKRRTVSAQQLNPQALKRTPAACGCQGFHAHGADLDQGRLFDAYGLKFLLIFFLPGCCRSRAVLHFAIPGCRFCGELLNCVSAGLLAA